MRSIDHTGRTRRRCLLSLVAISLVSAMITSAAFADTGESGTGHAGPVTVRIPVTHRITGSSYRGNDRFSFTLTADRSDYPMPEGSEGLSKTVTADRDGNVDFGEITFNRPDACCYTVTRGSEEHRSIREDDASYRVTIAALSSGEAEVVVQRIGEDGKSEGAKEDGIVYEDKYDAPPKTGDDTANAVLLGVFTLICLTALVLMLAARRKERQNEDIY